MKAAIAAASLLALSACVSNDFYVKNGVTLDRYERDGIGCATAATQAVPTNTQVGWAPYVGIYSVDTNNPLRDKNMELCMRDKGYQRVAIPYCSGQAQQDAIKKAAEPRSLSRVMSIKPNSCYIIDSKGKPFLHTP